MLAAYGATLFKTLKLSKNIHSKPSTPSRDIIQAIKRRMLITSKTVEALLMHVHGRAHDTEHWTRCFGLSSFLAEIEVFWEFLVHNTIKTQITPHEAVESFG